MPYTRVGWPDADRASWFERQPSYQGGMFRRLTSARGAPTATEPPEGALGAAATADVGWPTPRALNMSEVGEDDNSEGKGKKDDASLPIRIDTEYEYEEEEVGAVAAGDADETVATLLELIPWYGGGDEGVDELVTSTIAICGGEALNGRDAEGGGPVVLCPPSQPTPQPRVS